MLNAEQACAMTRTALCDEVDSILQTIERGVTRGAKRGCYGMYYTAPEDTDSDILEEVSDKLLDLGYRMTDWEKSYLGWTTRITWK